MTTFEVLRGLPPYGDRPEWFPATERGREGLVVSFQADELPTWVGNFSRGLSSFDFICNHPNGRDVVVIAGGTAFVVNLHTRALVESFGGQIDSVVRVPELSMLVFGNGLWFVAVGSSGRSWTTRRISWDGMRNLHREGLRIFGEAWSPYFLMAGSSWVPFEVELVSGECSGGSYEWAE